MFLENTTIFAFNFCNDGALDLNLHVVFLRASVTII